MVQIGYDKPAAFYVGLPDGSTAKVASLHVGSASEALLIWQAVSSCFASGAWLEDQPWTDEDGWADI